MKKKQQKRTLIILLSALLVVVLGAVLFYFAIPKVGYCFDTAFDENRERLYVTAGYRGLHVFSITPQGRIKHLATYYAGGYYRYLGIIGDRAYIANNEKGLEVVDIRQAVPKPVWTQSGSKGYGIHIANDSVYLASNDLGLQIFDIANPDKPVLIGHFPTNGRFWDVWVQGTLAFLADRDLGLIVVDVSTPTELQQVGSLSWGEAPMAEVIDGAGDYVYIAAGADGLIVVDVSDPTHPETAYRYDPGLDTYGEGVLVWGDVLYLSMIDSLSPEQNGLHIFDIREPAQPRLLSKYPISDGVEDISLTGTLLAVANTYSGVVLFDIQSRTAPTLVDMYPGRLGRFFTQFTR
ncbi:MAG: hypothetical protein JW963_17895 [Anaerolineales bacterium]|nr:hypothetical protein [Anaerolineales bacterium]